MTPNNRGKLMVQRLLQFSSPATCRYTNFCSKCLSLPHSPEYIGVSPNAMNFDLYTTCLFPNNVSYLSRQKWIVSGKRVVDLQ